LCRQNEYRSCYDRVLYVVRNIAVLWMCEVRMWSTIEWDRTYVFICVRVPYSVVYNNDELKEDILKAYMKAMKCLAVSFNAKYA
jgi:hypothetical protein